MNKEYLVIEVYHDRHDITQEVCFMNEKQLSETLDCSHIIGFDYKLVSDNDGIKQYKQHDTRFVDNDDGLILHYFHYITVIPKDNLSDENLYLNSYLLTTNTKHGILDASADNSISWAGRSDKEENNG